MLTSTKTNRSGSNWLSENLEKSRSIGHIKNEKFKTGGMTHMLNTRETGQGGPFIRDGCGNRKSY